MKWLNFLREHLADGLLAQVVIKLVKWVAKFFLASQNSFVKFRAPKRISGAELNFARHV